MRKGIRLALSLFILVITSSFFGVALAQDLVEFNFKVKPTQENTCITNTVTVNEPDKPVDSQDSATTEVGSPNPPCGEQPIAEACYTFDDSELTWPSEKKAALTEAINYLARAATFMNYICEGGKINVRWSNAPTNNTPDGNTIRFIDTGVSTTSLKQTAFTLAHESAHITQWRGQHVYQDYLNAGIADEGLICSYPYERVGAEWKLTEDFAEMAGIYVSWQNFPTSLCGQINYPTQYPNHYRFAKDNLFGDYEYFNY